MSEFFQVLHFEQLESTNNTAKQLLGQGLINKPTAIMAGTQTGGRGQMQTKWHDEAGKNILVSLVFPEMSLPVGDFFRLNMAACLAVCKVVSLYADCRIKWPNDVLLSNQKVAGLLIENVLQGNVIRSSIVGIGLNVNQLNWPETFRAVSLRAITGCEVHLPVVQEQIFSAFGQFYSDVKNRSTDTEYRSKLYGLGEILSFRHLNQPFTAEVIGVESDGRLFLRNVETQMLQSFHFKEVEWL
jgi:BirA family biotin operon repressor/biotin-[acetyl-CoA-carboxylase] ligase